STQSVRGATVRRSFVEVVRTGGSMRDFLDKIPATDRGKPFTLTSSRCASMDGTGQPSKSRNEDFLRASPTLAHQPTRAPLAVQPEAVIPEDHHEGARRLFAHALEQDGRDF